jgi:hypothetical protein
LGEPNWPNLPQMPPTQLLPKRRGQLAPTYAFARHLAIGVGMDGQRPCRTLAEDPGRTQPRAAYPRAAAQTRVVSLAGIRLRSWESARVFKGIICADVSEFESYMPSHAVGSLWRVYPVCVFALFRRGCGVRLFSLSGNSLMAVQSATGSYQQSNQNTDDQRNNPVRVTPAASLSAVPASISAMRVPPSVPERTERITDATAFGGLDRESLRFLRTRPFVTCCANTIARPT